MRPTDEGEWRGRVLMALDGLIPIAWIERAKGLEYLGSRVDLLPTDEERKQFVGVIVEADALAVPGVPGKKRATSLAALARTIVALAAVPGGVRFLGRRWEVVESGGMCRLVEGEAP